MNRRRVQSHAGGAEPPDFFCRPIIDDAINAKRAVQSELWLAIKFVPPKGSRPRGAEAFPPTYRGSWRTSLAHLASFRPLLCSFRPQRQRWGAPLCDRCRRHPYAIFAASGMRRGLCLDACLSRTPASSEA